MFLAQAEPVVHEVIVKVGSPWITIGAAALAALIAGLIACIGWYVVHRTSRSRDLLNWRRTALLQAVSSLLEASNARYEALTTDGMPRSELRKQYRRMLAANDQIRISSSGTIFSTAGLVMHLHTKSENQINMYQN